jgi:two-component system response regulator RegA
MDKRLLILDDDQKLAKALAIEFKDRNFEPTLASRISEIPNIVFQYAIIDLRLVGDFGLNAIEKIKQQSPQCKIVIVTGYGSVSTAVQAMKLGATDYLRKPCSVDEIESALLEKRNLTRENINIPSLSEIEHDYIDHVLTRNSGNISKTAKDLGLHRQSLQRKLKKYS